MTRMRVFAHTLTAILREGEITLNAHLVKSNARNGVRCAQNRICSAVNTRGDKSGSHSADLRIGLWPDVSSLRLGRSRIESGIDIRISPIFWNRASASYMAYYTDSFFSGASCA
jgi:hypothetical protein